MSMIYIKVTPLNPHSLNLTQKTLKPTHIEKKKKKLTKIHPPLLKPHPNHIKTHTLM